VEIRDDQLQLYFSSACGFTGSSLQNNCDYVTRDLLCNEKLVNHSSTIKKDPSSNSYVGTNTTEINLKKRTISSYSSNTPTKVKSKSSMTTANTLKRKSDFAQGGNGNNNSSISQTPVPIQRSRLSYTATRITKSKGGNDTDNPNIFKEVDLFFLLPEDDCDFMASHRIFTKKQLSLTMNKIFGYDKHIYHIDLLKEIIN